MNGSKEKFSIKKRIGSFRFAWEGFKCFIRSEHNAWIHIAATLAVIAFGVYYKISRTEWTAVCIAVALVFSAEMLNTAIEKLCDVVMPQQHESIKRIKDISAAAVLLCSVIACIIGLLIFLPKI